MSRLEYINPETGKTVRTALMHPALCDQLLQKLRAKFGTYYPITRIRAGK